MLDRIRRQWERAPGVLRVPIDVAVRTFKQYSEDECTTYAAAIAYYGIFSIVPLALITLSVLGLIVDRETIVEWVFEQMPLEESASVQENVNTAVERAQELSGAGIGLGLITLAWSASGIFGAVRKGLTATRHQARPRPFWRGKLLDLALIPSLGLLVLISIGLTAFARIALERAGEIGPFRQESSLLLRLSGFLLPSVATLMLFVLLYRFVPSARPRWLEALSGAVLATICFEVTKNLYAYYAANASFEQDRALYAGIGTALGFLFWMFLNASILLFGAEFGRAVREAWDGHRGKATAPRETGGQAVAHRTAR